MSFLIYGAYGYSGRLIARRAVGQGHEPVLAGRDPEALRGMAEALDIPFRVASLRDAEALRNALSGVDAVLHCAGPFVETARSMVDACLATSTHYLDITGEIDVFAALQELDDAAREAGIVCLPGVGFDVVPTDCLAASLHEALPSATALEIAIMSTGGWSGGTLKTAVSQLGQGGLVRREGSLRRVPPGWSTRTVDFGDRPRTVMAIPWGDLATAAHSTGIPNITTYAAMPRLGRRLLRGSRYVQGLLATAPVRALLRALVDHLDPGPSAEARRRGHSAVWASVRAPNGARRTARLHGPEAYTLTARTAVAAAERVMEGTARPGYHTPATAFGPSFATDIEGIERRDG